MVNTGSGFWLLSVNSSDMPNRADFFTPISATKENRDENSMNPEFRYTPGEKRSHFGALQNRNLKFLLIL
jgi:hypothetical protein